MSNQYKLAKIIPVDIYRRDLLLVANHSHKELEGELLQYLSNREARRIVRGCRGVCGDSAITIKTSAGGLIVYLPQYLGDEESFGTLAHELLHATSLIMEEVGIELSPHTQEAYAYLIGYLSKEAMKVLNATSCSSP